MTDLVQMLRDLVRPRVWNDLIELIVIAASVYAVMRFLKGTRGARLLRGFLLLLLGGTLILNLIANSFDLERIKVLYPIFVSGLFLSALVAFQPELRRALIRLGAATWFAESTTNVDRTVDEVIDAVEYMSKRKMGAIIAFEDEAESRGFAGCRLDAEVTKELLINIFWPNSPLHDMGAVISQGRIVAAAVQFPLADLDRFDAALGSRHRAAIGLSQETHALVLVVSEETGTIGLAEDGKLQRNLSLDALRNTLKTRLGAHGAPVTHE